MAALKEIDLNNDQCEIQAKTFNNEIRAYQEIRSIRIVRYYGQRVLK